MSLSFVSIPPYVYSKDSVTQINVLLLSLWDFYSWALTGRRFIHVTVLIILPIANSLWVTCIHLFYSSEIDQLIDNRSVIYFSHKQLKPNNIMWIKPSKKQICFLPTYKLVLWPPKLCIVVWNNTHTYTHKETHHNNISEVNLNLTRPSGRSRRSSVMETKSRNSETLQYIQIYVH